MIPLLRQLIKLIRVGIFRRWNHGCAAAALLALLVAPAASAQIPTCFRSSETITCNQSRAGELTFSDCSEDRYRFDLWRFSVAAGREIAVRLETDSFLHQPFLRLYNPTGGLAGETGPTAGNSRRAEFGGSILQGGTWTIYASEVDEFVTSAKYTLSVACSTAPPPPPPPAGGPCVEDATTACLLNGRFRATARFRNGFDGGPVDTVAKRKVVTGFGNSAFETEFFYFFNDGNIEVMVKMMDQGNKNAAGQPTIAVLTGTATPIRMEVTITDTLTGAVRTYTSPFGSQRGVTDFEAFVK